MLEPISDEKVLVKHAAVKKAGSSSQTLVHARSIFT
jgi:hypothetical protein